MAYFNPRSPRGGATNSPRPNPRQKKISIHAPHEGERHSPRIIYAGEAGISIHAPHEGERRRAGLGGSKSMGISIHAPHEGERQVYHPIGGADLYFNPRSPRGGATVILQNSHAVARISIHAPHEGERRKTADNKGGTSYFNPRSPRGGATERGCSAYPATAKFQSTLPTRGSDLPRVEQLRRLRISIHAPHEGERLWRHLHRAGARDISIHAPHEGERRSVQADTATEGGISIHAPHEGERRITS